jgi:hypothetical protein
VADVAEWMRDEVMSKEGEYELPQWWAVEQIEERFGIRGFTYSNENGNRAIHKEILAEFRRLTEGTVVWSRSERTWRKRKTRPGKRQAD